MSKTKNSTSELFKNEDEQQLFSSLTLFSTVVKCRTFRFLTLARPWTRRKWGKPTSCCPLCSKIVQSQKNVFFGKTNDEPKISTFARSRPMRVFRWRSTKNWGSYLNTLGGIKTERSPLVTFWFQMLHPWNQGKASTPFCFCRQKWAQTSPEGPGWPKRESCYKNEGWGGPNDPVASRGKPGEPGDPKTGSKSDKNCPYSRARR